MLNMNTWQIPMVSLTGPNRFVICLLTTICHITLDTTVAYVGPLELMKCQLSMYGVRVLEHMLRSECAWLGENANMSIHNFHLKSCPNVLNNISPSLVNMKINEAIKGYRKVWQYKNILTCANSESALPDPIKSTICHGNIFLMYVQFISVSTETILCLYRGWWRLWWHGFLISICGKEFSVTYLINQWTCAKTFPEGRFCILNNCPQLIDLQLHWHCWTLTITVGTEYMG